MIKQPLPRQHCQYLVYNGVYVQISTVTQLSTCSLTTGRACEWGYVKIVPMGRFIIGKWMCQMNSLVPGHSQILSRSCGEKSAEGLGSLLHHRLEILYHKQFTADSNFMTLNTYTRRLISVNPIPAHCHGNLQSAHSTAVTWYTWVNVAVITRNHTVKLNKLQVYNNHTLSILPPWWLLGNQIPHLLKPQGENDHTKTTYQILNVY